MEEFGIILTSVSTCDQLSVGFETLIRSFIHGKTYQRGTITE